METYQEGGKSWAIGFLLNSTQNKAKPDPFQIPAKILMKVAKTAIGKPWLPGAGKGNTPDHFQPDGVASQTAVLDQHMDKAQGIITDVIPNPSTGNVAFIIDVDKEFAKKIEKGEVSDYLSPLLDSIIDAKTGEIVDAVIVHVHSVDAPGYHPSIAKFYGTCEGTHEKCINELVPLAASGSTNNTFIQKNQSKPMSAQIPNGGQPQPAEQPIVTDVDGDGDLDVIRQSVTAMGGDLQHTQDVADSNSEIMKQMAAAAGIDPSGIQMCKAAAAAAPETMQQPDPAAVAGMPKQVSAAGDTKAQGQILKLTQQIETLKKREEERDAKEAATRRRMQAEIIAKGEIALHLGGLTTKDYKTRVDKYMTMKQSETSDDLMDLTLTASNYKSISESIVQKAEPAPIAEEVPITVSASGYGLIDNEYPAQEPATEAPVDYDALEADI